MSVNHHYCASLSAGGRLAQRNWSPFGGEHQEEWRTFLNEWNKREAEKKGLMILLTTCGM